MSLSHNSKIEMGFCSFLRATLASLFVSHADLLLPLPLFLFACFLNHGFSLQPGSLHPSLCHFQACGKMLLFPSVPSFFIRIRSGMLSALLFQLHRKLQPWVPVLWSCVGLQSQFYCCGLLLPWVVPGRVMPQVGSCPTLGHTPGQFIFMLLSA